MKKTHYLALFLLIFALIIISGCAKNNLNPNQSNIILYYGDGCPHCGNVEAFIKEHNLTEKIKFEQKEVFNNKDNAADMTDKAAACNIPQEKLGVPLLWDGMLCYEGDQNIIKFFKEKLDEK